MFSKQTATRTLKLFLSSEQWVKYYNENLHEKIILMTQILRRFLLDTLTLIVESGKNIKVIGCKGWNYEGLNFHKMW